MSGLPSGFGKKFANTGKFGKKGRKKIRNKFGSVQNFLDQGGLQRGVSTQQQARDAFNAGPTQQPTVAPPSPQPTQPSQDPVQNQQQNVGTGLTQQATDLTNVGANILNQGNPASQPLLNAGNNFQTGAQQDLGKVDALAGAARAQGQNILNTLSQQQQAADQDIQNLFNAQPLDTLRSNLAQLNSAAQASGRTNSRSTNELNAELQRGLIRDQAAARLGSNNQFRDATINELGNQRQTDLGLGNLFSSQGLGQGNLGNQSLLGGGNLINNTNQLGADIFNNGLNQQFNALGFINNAAQQNFNTQNQLLQKALGNIQGAKQNRQTQNLIQQQLEAAQQGGGGFLSGALGGLGGALGGLF